MQRNHTLCVKASEVVTSCDERLHASRGLHSSGAYMARCLAPVSCMLSLVPSPQGVILVYDIANRWSFDGINRWIKEIDEV